jgi:ATP-dependent Clp protease, protease subunit
MANLPPEVYGTYVGSIDQDGSQRLVNNITGGIQKGVKHFHILFQSNGGGVAEGVFLYNLFRSLPIEVSLYNGGQVCSAALIAYLGATHRKSNPRASFMVHRSTLSPQPATSKNLRHVAQSLALDDARTEAILRDHVKFPDELWTEMQYHDLHLSAEEAVKFSIADEIGEFSPPLGTLIYNMLAL